MEKMEDVRSEIRCETMQKTLIILGVVIVAIGLVWP